MKKYKIVLEITNECEKDDGCKTILEITDQIGLMLADSHYDGRMIVTDISKIQEVIN